MTRKITYPFSTKHKFTCLAILKNADLTWLSQCCRDKFPFRIILLSLLSQHTAFLIFTRRECRMWYTMKFKILVAEKRMLPRSKLIIALVIFLSILSWRALPRELAVLTGLGIQRGPRISNFESSSLECFAAIGDWCLNWYAAPKYVSWESPPLGNKSCLWNCNNVGVSTERYVCMSQW